MESVTGEQGPNSIDIIKVQTTFSIEIVLVF